MASLLATRAARALGVSAARRGYCAMSTEVATGVNILKTGQDPPLRKDEDLPEWLWELTKPDKTLAELQRADFDELTFEEKKRLVKLDRRSRIRAHNMARAK